MTMAALTSSRILSGKAEIQAWGLASLFILMPVGYFNSIYNKPIVTRLPSVTRLIIGKESAWIFA